MFENHRGRLFPQRRQQLAELAFLLQKEAQLRLQSSGYRELQSVSCEYSTGVLTLRGRIPSFYLKQIAQTLIRDLVGEICNRLEVSAETASS